MQAKKLLAAVFSAAYCSSVHSQDDRLECEMNDGGKINILCAKENQSCDLVLSDSYFTGEFVEQKHHIYIIFPKGENRYETRLTLNKYTGEISWEHGTEPFGEASPNNVFRSGQCDLNN